ncbi:MarR family winged helix-turn-helix transcriptional regulator [Fictibacillus iocasae]|uniref:MarR family winged helix-turn-helix transcriptional regulator n=1 Tax=Fictibacillus iocasae TaxID=2715437 RepID=A0ABW2NV24_9BACL
MGEKYLEDCLYFNVNRMSRAITRLAEKCFKDTGLSPTLAFMLMVANNKPGISQTELGAELHIAPSTITRFVDKLVSQQLIERKANRTKALIYPTDKGLALQQALQHAWNDLQGACSEYLGEKNSQELTALLSHAGDVLEEKN